MANNKYYKIGDLAEMNGISTNTLRFYDKIGLFKPGTRGSNGYRYYSADQLTELDLIIWRRMNGASIDETKAVIEEKSLSNVLHILERNNEKLQKNLELLENQLYANRYYISQMNKCMELGENECYLMEFDERYIETSDVPIESTDRAGYELQLKNIFKNTENSDSYFNSFFGVYFPYSRVEDHYKSR